MADRQSALAGYYRPGIYGAPGATSVTVQLLPELQLQQLAAWPETVMEIERLALKFLSVTIRPGFGAAVERESAALMRVEPLKWWLLGAVIPDPNPELGVVLDISHSRTHLIISGESSAVLLNRYLPLDLRPESCPPGTVMSSAIHHVGITLWRSERGFELLIPRGFAVSIFELLCEGAEQFGYEILPELKLRS